MFDFNGDGASEVVYNDECSFRIYDGASGDVLFKEASESRTRTEYPIVADTGNDGNAEIVFGVSSESGFCSEDLDPLYNNGLEVWGDDSDTWVSARRVSNQHAYHVTNVTESAAVPDVEPKGWISQNGRLYNTYRSNGRGTAPDRIRAIADSAGQQRECDETNNDLIANVDTCASLPDLRVSLVHDNPACTDYPTVETTIHNDGTVSAFDVEVTFYLGDPEGGGAPLRTEVFPGELVAGGSLMSSIQITEFPQCTVAEVWAVVDDADAVTECVEANNIASRGAANECGTGCAGQ
ncbi:MAG: hypothetical protein OXT09_15850 [Myxococcales bacterium]|nr:hypothetical protein [Myxococcales bacterium]